MKKRVLAVLAATALVGVASAYAANPFADVPTSSWAYQAVTQLAEQGVVVGYPDGYFKGQRNITRYEMAQIIARAMTRADRIDAQQQAMINKLAAEYATELRNLGVRVDALEDRIGNVKLTGDARIKYENKKMEGGEREDRWEGRARIGVNGMVGEKTAAGARIVMKTGIKDDTKDAVTFDRLWVKHNMGQIALTAGRQGLILGEGLAFDSKLDGVTVGTNLNKNAGILVGYGHINDFVEKKNDTITFAQIGGKVADNVSLKGYYGRAHTSFVLDHHMDIYGVSAKFDHKNFWIGGEWAKTGDWSDNQAWTAAVGVGNYDQNKAGTFGASVRYVNFESEFYGQATTFSDYVFVDDDMPGNNFKGWGVNGSYALADGLGLEVDYYFKGKTQNGNKTGDNLIASLNYKF